MFEKYPNLTNNQYLAYRSLIGCLIMLIYHNFHIYNDLVLQMNREAIKPLIGRVFFGIYAIFVYFMGVKYFQLTTIAMVMSTGPLVTFVLALLIFKEKSTLL